MNDTKVKRSVRQAYAAIADQSGSCCGPNSCGCGTDTSELQAKSIGYSDQQLKDLPEGANLGLGCGNPVGLASVREDDVVLDLGSGAGIDCFLAADAVGQSGRVIGVDMTPEMIDKARANALNTGHVNVEFRLGEIENLPVADSSVDLTISNCVINLSPDKRKVFEETFRVTKPGGRLTVSDIVLQSELPESVRYSVEAYVSCVAGASLKDDYLQLIRSVGFTDVNIEAETIFGSGTPSGDGDSLEPQITGSITSITVSAVKPLQGF